MKIIRKADLREGLWRNGLGVSWDIATEADNAGPSGFGWRLAIARIDADVPFSLYPETDRIFTLIEGAGLTLEFEGRSALDVDRLFVPHAYPCDVPTICRLRHGPCRALNLFTARGRWHADASVHTQAVHLTHAGPILLFAMERSAGVGDQVLQEGDAAITRDRVDLDAANGVVFAAMLTKA